MIRVVSYNIHALLSKLGCAPLVPSFGFDTQVRPFSDIVSILEPDVILLQEVNVVGLTLTNINFPFHLFPRYHVYFSNNFRSVILVRDWLSSSGLSLSLGGRSHSRTYSSCWVKIIVPRCEPLVFCSLYRPGSCPAPVFENFWSELSNASSVSSLVFVCGDFNAEHRIWGAPATNSTGNLVANGLLMSGFQVVPLPSPSFRPYGSGPTVGSFIDLTCSTTNGLSRLSDWCYDFRYCVESDHNPISFSVDTGSCQNSSRARPFEIWNVKDGDWRSFRLDLHHYLGLWVKRHGLETNCDPNEAALSWCNTVLSAAHRCIGKKSILPGSSRKWWNRKIKNLIRLKNRLRKKYQSSRCPSDLTRFRKARLNVRNAIQDAKSAAWDRVVNTLNTGEDSDFCRIYRRICSDKSLAVPPLTAGGTVVDSDKEKADLLLTTFRRAAVGSGSPSFISEVETLVSHVRSELSFDDPFPSSLAAIENTISSLSERKAFGPDDIHVLFLKNGGDTLVESLLVLFRICWRRGVFPRCFKNGKICPISKLPKPSSNPRSYRPIALLSVVGKLFEGVILQPLRSSLLSNARISRFQAGFLPARNCEEQVVRLVEDIFYQFEIRGAVTAVFLDISKAYDSVWRDGLRLKLNGAGISGNLFAVLDSFLSDRKLCVELNRIRSRWEVFDFGVPQGSKLSPILFILFIDDLARGLEQFTLISFAFFADDICLWTKPCLRQMHPVAVAQLQDALHWISDWSHRWRLTFNPSKCCAVHFTHCDIPKPSLVLNGSSIEFKPHARYLGVYLDEKLSFRVHVDHIHTKVLKRIGMARALVDRSVGLSMKRFVILYIACIRTCMEFAAAVWSARADIRSLEQAQLLSLRIATGARKSTPSSALEVWCGVPPLDVRFSELRCRLRSRAIRLPRCHPLSSTLASSDERYKSVLSGTYSGFAPFRASALSSRQFGVWRDECSHRLCPIELNPTPTPPVDLGLVELTGDDAGNPPWSSVVPHLSPNVTVLYTDGSVECNPGPGGAGVFIEKGLMSAHRSRSLGGLVTIGFAELSAIKLALEWALTNGHHYHIVILSDSRHSINAIRGTWNVVKHRSLVLDIRSMFLSLRSRCLVSLCKIRAHSGIRGNDEADSLAKKAAASSSRVPALPVDYDTAKVLIKRAARSAWQNRWSRSQTQLRSIVTTVSQSRRKHLDGLRRGVSATITQLATGHFPVASYLFDKQGSGTSAACWCGMEETVPHLLFDCPIHRDARMSLADSVSGTATLTLQSILFDNRNRFLCYMAVAKYLKDIGRTPF